MSTTTSSSSLISSLISCGSRLAALLQRAKSREGSSLRLTLSSKDSEISDRDPGVGVIIDELLEYSRSAKDPDVKQCLGNVMRKIEDILQECSKEFGMSDNAEADKYRELVKKIEDFKSPVKQSLWSGDFSQEAFSLSISKSPEESNEFDSKFERLTPDLKRCLFCFSLFPQGVELKKRDLIFWWIGMGLANEFSNDGGKLLADEVINKLVAEGFINPLIINKRLSSRYNMHANVHSKVQQAALQAMQKGSFSVIKYVHDMISDGQQLEKEKIEGTLNMRKESFYMKFDWLSALKNAKVVHLGSWGRHRGSKDEHFILIEDISSLQNALKNLRQAKFLGLQGISGILQLPDSVCQLVNLEVLDLRACNNLESLPKGIGSLKKLTHLDVSECFLLDYIPQDITSLSNLRVIKGFVINSVNGRYSCAFNDLAHLKELRKLALRTRRMNFPTRQDLQTLCEMKHLDNLRIAWVGNPSDARSDGDIERFPATVKKLELQTVPAYTAVQLLALISKQKDSVLEKLYIIGGGLRKLDPKKHSFSSIKAVRLRYLSKLRIMDWNDILKLFPNVTSLIVFECPNLDFTCDENGWWERD